MSINRRSSILIFCSLILCTFTKAQDLRINEAMSSNSVFLDEDDDSPDWFELYNFGDETISLDGYSVSDSLEFPKQWIFPAMVMPPNTHLLVWASDKDRKTSTIAKTLVTLGDEFKYLIPNSELDASWTTLGFDDSGWETGNSGFGYADDDDETVVPNGTKSVFIRREFTISDKDRLEELFLDIDYDDAFVAYINGKEVARNNINGTPPSFNASAILNHEAVIYQNGEPERFFIEMFDDLLVNGENILCIQGHNVSNTSTDFTLNPFLSAFYGLPTPDGVQPPEVLNLLNKSVHTNFKISSKGETIYLFDPQGVEVDRLRIENLSGNISVGKDVNENVVFYDVPSPGSPNAITSFSGILRNREISFSNDGGTVSALNLTLSGASDPEVIRYTLDASEPTENSPIYNSLISIARNTTVRARIFRENYVPSNTQTNTYIIGKTHDLPVLMLVTEPANFFDEKDGIYVLGSDYPGGRVPFFGSNIWNGEEKPINFTLYEADGTKAISFDGGVRIFGGWSRAQPQKGLSIFARKNYGAESIEYPIFPQQPYSSYQSLVLRNSGNDFLRTQIRDAVMTGLMKGADIETQAYRPAVTYLNGEYWGFYNMREKMNEHYLASRFGVDPDEVDIVERNSATVHGTNKDYLTLINFVSSNDLSNESNYAKVTEQIDIDNFILYYAAQIYFDNTDWPGNNNKFWKPKGGKWRWMLFDTDFGFRGASDNTLVFALNANGPNHPNPPWSTLLFRKLIENEAFRNKFINRMSDEMNSRFLSKNVNIHIDSLSAKIASEIPAHFSKWGNNSSGWQGQLNQMKDFGSSRAANMRNHLKSQFGLETTRDVTVQVSDINAGLVKVNDLVISDKSWSGSYFQGVPIKIKAIAKPGYSFSHWSVDIDSSNPEIEIDITKNTTVIANFDVGSQGTKTVVINEINYNSGEDHKSDDWIELYNTNTEFAVDLSKWVFKDSDDTHSYELPAGTIINARSYLVLSKDLVKFKEIHSEVENAIGEFDFGLSSDGETLRLYDETNTLRDEVSYSSESPWPEDANGKGPSLELIRATIDNNSAENWVAVTNGGSPGRTNTTGILGLFDKDITSSLSYYPNPFSNSVTLDFELKSNSKIIVNVFDLRGELMAVVFDNQLPTGRHKIEYDLGWLNSGVYILNFVENGESRSFKWIKALGN